MEQNLLEEVYAMKARIKFNKQGTMKFIGHLDIMRYFQKAFRRCGIDVSYSKGFNPHQLMSFAAPLGVGLTSDGEYMDLQLESCLSSKEMIEKINSVMNEEIQIIEFVGLEDEAKNAMSIVSAADYEISFKDGYDEIENLKDQIREFFQQDQIIIEKKTKKTIKEIDLKPFIYHMDLDKKKFLEKVGQPMLSSVANKYKNGKVIYLQLAAGSVINIKPELVLEAFCNFANRQYKPFAYQFHRMEVYANRNMLENKQEEIGRKERDLIPLGKLGFEIKD